MVGTPAYMAPQILNEEKYTYKCDIWSLGVMAYEMIVGRLPWLLQEKTLPALKKEVMSRLIAFPEHLKISDGLKDFIRGCLCIDEAKRMNWQQIFLHPLFESRFKKNF
jgi:serine/threonine protein kinase